MTIPANVANNLNKPFELCYLIKIEFSGLTLSITDAPFEIDHDGLTYIPSDLLVSVGDIKNSSETKVNTTNLAFSSVDQTIVALMLANNQIGRDVYIYQVYFYEDNLRQSGTYVEEVSIGEISGFTNASERDSSLISLSISSLYADWERKAGRVTSNSSQQLYYPNDLGMEWANAVQSDLKWGGK